MQRMYLSCTILATLECSWIFLAKYNPTKEKRKKNAIIWQTKKCQGSTTRFPDSSGLGKLPHFSRTCFLNDMLLEDEIMINMRLIKSCIGLAQFRLIM